MRAPVAPKGCPMRERATVHVEALGIDGAHGLVAAQPLAGEGVAAEHLQDREHLRGEGLVHVHEVDVREA
jgi:hypothetical protein